MADETAAVVAQNGQNGEQRAPVRPQWTGKACPVLSIASVAGAQSAPSPIIKSTVERVPEKEPTAIGCQGPACMWFVPTQDDGKLTGDGSCALTLFPIAVNHLGMAMLKFTENYRLKAKS